MADNLKNLWKEYEETSRMDLPSSEIETLDQIIVLAKEKEQYGYLIKASELRLECYRKISADSLSAEIERIEKIAEETDSSSILYALYNSLLGKTYESNFNFYTSPSSYADHINKAKVFFTRSVSTPQISSQFIAKDLYPYYSKDNEQNLLTQLSYEASIYKTSRDFFKKTGDRLNAFLMSLQYINSTHSFSNKKGYLKAIDSLISEYGDLNACCEAAIIKYRILETSPKVSVEEKIRFIRQSLKKWGKWENSDVLRNEELNLTRPSFSLEISKTQIAENQKACIVLKNVRNIKKITTRIWKTRFTSMDVADPLSSYYEAEKFMKEAVKSMKPSKAITIKNSFDAEDYEFSKIKFNTPKLDKGIYIIETSCNDKNVKPVYNILYVSNLFIIAQPLPDNNTRFAVVNIQSGHPVSNCSLTIRCSENWDKSYDTEVVCDENGEVVFTSSDDIESVFAYSSDDKFMMPTDIDSEFHNYENNDTCYNLEILTDRSIYRPGQTVKVAAVAYRNIGNKDIKADANTKINLMLIDANNKVVGKKNIITDAYGKASAEFVLPTNTLSGRFKLISDRRGITTIRVEEYKRPTFDVKFTQPDVQYHFGDTLRVNGKAESFTGIPLQGARVKYVIKKAHLPWLRYFTHSYDEPVADGELSTSADGSFYVDVPLIPDGKEDSGIYYFTIEAFVTDAAGETQNTKIALPVSKRNAWIECDIPEKIERSALRSMRINVKNISNQDIDTYVTFFIDNKKGYMVKAGTDISIDDKFSDLSSGRHKLTITALDEKIEKEFVLFSLEDKVPAVNTKEWIYVTSDTFPADGGSVFLQLGTSLKKVHALYSIISGNKEIKSGSIELNNSVNTYELKYRQEYGDGILITYAWVKGGKMYSDKVYIKKSLPEKKLRLKWNIFRNRLIPGQQEEWTLNISSANGMAADASLAATLYDMSLDNITGHTWEHVYGLSTSLPFNEWTGTKCNEEQTNTSVAEIKYYKVRNNFTSNSMHITSCNNMVYDVCESAIDGAMPNGVYESKRLYASTGALPDMRTADKESSSESEDTAEEKIPVLREILDETAFFYPALTTDAEGNINISFTLPESLTTWKFMAFANDKEMNNEVFTDKAVARKEVMIQPNMPRFVRHGDRAVISARISNLSDKEVSGTAHMHICDAESGRIIEKGSCEFSLAGGETDAVSFKLNADINEDIVICKIFAEGNNFSDGEQHYLSILSDRELITNTHAVTLTDAGKISLDAKSLLSDKASDNRFTLEYTDSPQWFAIESLPSIALDDRDDAISIARTIYANMMARHIAIASPATKEVIERLTKEQSGTSLLSSLEKNAELKDIVLAETPWVSEAESETERIKHLGELFDENLMQKRISQAIAKLKQSQLSDGSWGWWKGMRGSRYITATVTEMLMRINAMTESDGALDVITDNALKYLAKEAKDEIEAKKKLDEYYITTFGISYLYLRSFANEKEDKYTKILVDKLLELSPKDMNIYEKSMAATVLFRKGYREKAAELLQSVREYSVYKSETGRYFDSDAAGYSWCDYKIPTQVMAIEALSEVSPEHSRTIDEMKQWLLNEKRTTSWDTPINSVNAIYALTKGGSNISENNESSTIKINGKNIVPAIPETGYVKTSDNGSCFDIEIDKKSNGTSWLSMYGSYTAEIRDVKRTSTGLNIKREILSADNKGITVGSKIKVRITITADRDYDFVQVTDKRAACMEPVNQISGYNGRYYCSMKDNAAYYYFDMMPKGTHVIETEYYADRKGTYSTGLCKVQCAYAPEYSGRTEAETITVK